MLPCRIFWLTPTGAKFVKARFAAKFQRQVIKNWCEIAGSGSGARRQRFSQFTNRYISREAAMKPAGIGLRCYR